MKFQCQAVRMERLGWNTCRKIQSPGHAYGAEPGRGCARHGSGGRRFRAGVATRHSGTAAKVVCVSEPGQLRATAVVGVSEGLNWKKGKGRATAVVGHSLL